MEEWDFHIRDSREGEASRSRENVVDGAEDGGSESVASACST